MEFKEKSVSWDGKLCGTISVPQFKEVQLGDEELTFFQQKMGLDEDAANSQACEFMSRGADAYLRAGIRPSSTPIADDVNKAWGQLLEAEKRDNPERFKAIVEVHPSLKARYMKHIQSYSGMLSEGE